MFAGCFICRSWRSVSNFTGSKSLEAYLSVSILAWQLPRQFAIVLRFGWKERALVEVKSGCLIGQGSGLTRLVFRASGGQVIFGVWLTSWNEVNNAVLCQINQSFVVKHNKQFKQTLNAQHFWFASSLVLPCNAESEPGRFGLLNWALVASGKNAAKVENLGLMNRAILLGFVLWCSLPELRSIFNVVVLLCRFRR